MSWISKSGKNWRHKFDNFFCNYWEFLIFFVLLILGWNFAAFKWWGLWSRLPVARWTLWQGRPWRWRRKYQTGNSHWIDYFLNSGFDYLILCVSNPISNLDNFPSFTVIVITSKQSSNIIGFYYLAILNIFLICLNVSGPTFSYSLLFHLLILNFLAT